LLLAPYARSGHVVIPVTYCWDWLQFQCDFIVKGHSMLLLCYCKCFALLFCQANVLLCPMQVVVLRDIKSCSVEEKKERDLLISVMHLHYNEVMLCTICESVAKIKYTMKINYLFVLPIQLLKAQNGCSVHRLNIITSKMCLSACVQFKQYLQGFGSRDGWREERIHDKFRMVHTLEKSSQFSKIKISGETVSAYFHAA